MNKKYYSRYNYNLYNPDIESHGLRMPTTRVRYDLFFNEDNFLTPEIKRVIHNNPATIVFWGDGTKTVVKCQEDDRHGYSERVGLLMCIAKKFFGNTGHFNDILTEYSADDIPDFTLPKFDEFKIESGIESMFNKKN